MAMAMAMVIMLQTRISLKMMKGVIFIVIANR